MPDKKKTTKAKNPKDDEKTEVIKFLKAIKIKKISGFSTLFDTVGQYDALSTKHKRLVVETFEKATKKDGNRSMPLKKQVFISLEWKFKCPDCNIEKDADCFVPNEFDYEVPGDEDSEPVLTSRYGCTVCT